MSKYAVVLDGLVINTVIWDGLSEWAPDEGEAIASPDDVEIGWVYADGSFINPNTPPAPTQAELYESELLALNIAYDKDKQSLAYEYLTAGLFDGSSEESKKAEIYGRLQERNKKYADDMISLDNKYGGQSGE